jgi:EAL domain-containing protein (putative c-di-GMP-specific phosphodiesterase class I)
VPGALDMQLAADLRTLLGSDDEDGSAGALEVFYQPIVNVSGTEEFGRVEALVRWRRQTQAHLTSTHSARG